MSRTVRSCGKGNLQRCRRRIRWYMQNLGLVLMVFSFVCFVIACFSAAAPHWNKLVAAGLAFLVAAEIFGGLSALHYLR